MSSIAPVLEFLLDKLVSTMGQQFLLYEEILETSRRKQTLLSVGRRGNAETVQKEVDELTRLSAIEEGLIQQAAGLDKERGQFASDAAVQLGLGSRAASVTLRELIGILREALARSDGGDALADAVAVARLEELHRKLGDVLAEVGRVNELNGLLLRQSLAYIDFSMNLLTGATDSASYDYGAVIGGKQDGSGRKTGSGNRKAAILDVRA